MLKIIQKKSPNFIAGRVYRGTKKEIIAVVNHITAGSSPGCVDWLCNPKAKASAHYVVLRSGRVYQLVADKDTAWHAGGVDKPSWPIYDGTNPNYYTIGIEHEGYGTQGGDGTLTQAQYQATVELHKILVARYHIPVDADHIIGHYRIDSVNRPNCPGKNFPFERLLKDLNPESTTVKITVGAKVIEGTVENGRTVASVRDIGEALGKTIEVVKWEPGDKQITIK